MTWADEIDSAAQHYATLAQQPGWFQHCKQLIIEMEAMHNGHCWGGLRKRWGALLTQAGYKVPDGEKDGWWIIPSKLPSGSQSQGRHP